jgi:hypothetical protein
MNSITAPRRIELAPVDALPDAGIPPGSAIREAFLGRGLTTFHQACGWVKRLPYGPNPAGDHELALFDDGCGTCATKHGVIAALAAELGLEVHKTIGFYRLTAEIVTGVDPILARHGLRFIPQMHCFLECDGRYVDLTEGNITGKNKTIDTYDFIVRVPPALCRDDAQRLYREYLKLYGRIHPHLAELEASAVQELVRECNQVTASRRLIARPTAPAPGPPFRSPIPASD